MELKNVALSDFNTSTTPKVQYAYSEMTGGANHSRLTQMVYPQGATVNYVYGSGVDSAISRITSAEMLSTGNATLSSESYSYLGLASVVEKTMPVVTLSYIQSTGDTSANTDAGDQYTGLDRFGRVIDQVWRDSGSGALLDRYQYGYDRTGNRLFKNNLVDSAMSELYGYDNLNQLTDFARGVLSDANSDGLFDTVASPVRTQAWSLDAIGNWSTLTTNSTSQSRTHNAQNQVTGVGSTTLTFDANGSMTADETGRVFIYDAWNRLVAVRNSSNSPIVGYAYDALGRRIIEDRPNANTVDHLYYSTAWQVLEERRDGTSSGDVRRQYFWSIDYVDALTARVDYASGAVSATYHAQYDANWNVTAIADASTSVLERYAYDPYGAATVLYANWSARGGSPYGWNYLHQGGRFDVDSNLYHFRHRDYSASLGRWTQTDPIGFSSGDENFYRYVGNSPGNAVDPFGLEKIEIIYVPLPSGGSHSLILVTDPKTGIRKYYRGGPSNNLNNIGSTKQSSACAGTTGGATTQKCRRGYGSESSNSSNGTSPGASPGKPGGYGGWFGPIVCNEGDFIEGTVDWPKGEPDPSERFPKIIIIDNGNSAKPVNDQLKRLMIEYEDREAPYNPLTNNCNSFSHQAIEDIGFPRPVPPPAVWAPGHRRGPL